MDARPAIVEIERDLNDGVAVPLVAARFHNAVAEATARACVLAAERGGTEVVVLSGGVFQNRRLLERTSSLLGAAGLRVLVPERLPPNDGGIAYGQLAAAAARLAAEEANAP
jgi:hydrogenase maturation protein HypF